MIRKYYIACIDTNLILDWYSGSYFLAPLNEVRNGLFDSEGHAYNFLLDNKDSIVFDLGAKNVEIKYFLTIC